MLNNGEGTGRKKQNLCQRKKEVEKAKLSHKICLFQLMIGEHETGKCHRRDGAGRDTAYE